MSILSSLYRRVRHRIAAYERNLSVGESEERFRAFFDNPAIGATQVDLQGRFQEVNYRFCQMTGYTRDELLRMSPADLFLPEDRERELESLVRYLEGDVQVYDVEKRYRRKDGRVIWVHVTAGLIRDGAGRPVRSGGIIEDITVRKSAEEALHRYELVASGVAVGPRPSGADP